MDERTQTKTCSKCGETKLVAEFYRYRVCKACHAADLRAYRLANPEKVREFSKRSYERYAERHRTAARTRYAANAEAERDAARRRYRAKTPEELEIIYRRNKARRQANPDKAAEYTKRYRSKNPNVMRTINQNRRARRGGKTVSLDELEALWTGDCALCGEPIEPDLAWPNPMSRTIDHIVPLAKGGPHEAANLQWAHFACNRRKSDHLPSPMTSAPPPPCAASQPTTPQRE